MTNSIFYPVVKIEKGERKEVKEEIVCELPLVIYLNQKEFARLVCSPQDLETLSIGFLCAEGVLKTQEELKEIKIEEKEGKVWVETTTAAPWPARQDLKRYLTSSGAQARLDYPLSPGQKINSSLIVAPTLVSKLAARLESESQLFQRTGGVHNAALFEKEELLTFQTDLGRHNALDRVFGFCFRRGMTPRGKILAFSGRVSAEILLKVAKMEVPLLISRAPPTDFALRLALALGVTVVGFVRNEKMNVYTYPERIRAEA